MELQLKPELEAKLDQLVSDTGRSKSDFVEDALAGYLDELNPLRDMLDKAAELPEIGHPRPDLTSRSIGFVRRYDYLIAYALTMTRSSQSPSCMAGAVQGYSPHS